MFGTRIKQGRLKETQEMVGRGKTNDVAQELFALGPRRAKESQGSCTTQRSMKEA